MIWALHGNLGYPTDWGGVEKALGEPLEAINLWEEPILPFSEWAYRLNDRASALDPAPVLLGYSLGGRLAMHCLTGIDAPWEAAIFVSAHPGLRFENERAERRAKDADWAEILREEKPMNFLEKWNGQPVLLGNESPPRQLGVLLAYMSAVVEAFETWSLGRQADLRPELAKSGVPQLWVVGENDTKFRKIAEGAVDLIPTAQLVVIPECGHRVMLEKPRELAEAIREFLVVIQQNGG